MVLYTKRRQAKSEDKENDDYNIDETINMKYVFATSFWSYFLLIRFDTKKDKEN